jgi:gliding motility-associated lipoprotein GldD
MYKNSRFYILFFLLILFVACESNYTPLPRAYFRIDLPEKEYRNFDSLFPYRFQYPVYAEIIPDTRNNAEPWWTDVYFPKFKAVLHLSYKSISSEMMLNEYIEDSRSFVNRHIPKATEFNEKIYTNEAQRVYGILYEIKGKEAATPVQFYLTDSTSHFLRGSLYFNVSPNNDSLAPVIKFIKEDIMLLVESLEWTR